MLPPVEIVAVFVVLVLLSGGLDWGVLELTLGMIWRGWTYLSRVVRLGQRTAPISINNHNIKQSDASVEVHYHYHRSEYADEPTISDGGSVRSKSNNYERTPEPEQRC